MQEHRLTKIRRLNIEDDVSIQRLAASYIQPEAWYALSPDQRKSIIQVRQKDPTSYPNSNPNADGQGESVKKDAKKARWAKTKDAKRKAWLEAKKGAAKSDGEEE